MTILYTRYGRTDVLALGKFTLNLTKCSPSLVESLHTLLDAVVPKVRLIPNCISTVGMHVHFWSD